MHARPHARRSLGRAGFAETSRFRAGECLRFWGSSFLTLMDQSLHCACVVGTDSSVGIATRCGLYDPRIESRWEWDFLTSIRRMIMSGYAALLKRWLTEENRYNWVPLCPTQIANTGLRRQKRGDVSNSLARKFPASYVIWKRSILLTCAGLWFLSWARWIQNTLPNPIPFKIYSDSIFTFISRSSWVCSPNLLN